MRDDDTITKQSTQGTVVLETELQAGVRCLHR